MLLASRRSLLSFGAVAICAGVLLAAGVTAGESKAKRPVMKPQYDPSLPKVDLFDAIDDGTLEARMIAKDQFGGNVLVTNKSDAPISVKLPDAIVGVQVFPQMGGMGMGGMGGGGMGGMGGGGMGGMGGGQAMGGGMGGGGMGGGGMGGMGMGGGGMGGMGGGGGFFSIPAGRTVKVPFNSVCLEHGKANPRPSMHYVVVRPTDYSKKPELHELLKLVATNKLDKDVAQAAAWNIASEMSWQELAAEEWQVNGGFNVPYFSRDQLMAAQSVVATATAKAQELAEKAKTEQPETPAPGRLSATSVTK